MWTLIAVPFNHFVAPASFASVRVRMNIFPLRLRPYAVVLRHTEIVNETTDFVFPSFGLRDKFVFNLPQDLVVDFARAGTGPNS